MEDLNLYTSFIGGVLSFLSPCVLPLIPLYLSYLGINKGDFKENLKIMFGFCFGIMSVFIILTLGIKALTPIILKYQTIISLIGGVIMIILGLHQLGFIEIKVFNKEKRINLIVDKVSFIKAYILGFIYSFSWTPCISPVVATIVTLSISSVSSLSWLYIFVYGLGFALPFILVGLAFKKLLNILKKYQKFFTYLLKAFAVMIIFIGLYMIYDASKTITSAGQSTTDASSETQQSELLYVNDIERYDQEGNTISFDDYEGNYLLITFSATWCGYCSQQEAFMEEYIKTHDDIIPFIIMSDDINLKSGGISTSEYAINKTIPILSDDGSLFYKYGATSFPSNMIVGPDGSIVAGFAGAITSEESMANVLKQVKDIYESR